jgi:hypothetical protein
MNSLADTAATLSSQVLGSATGTGLAIIAMVSLVGGYILLAGLWYFVFREKPAERAERRRREAAAMHAAGYGDSGEENVADLSQARGPVARAAAAEGPGAHRQRLEIDRPSGSRFRRR